MLLPSLVLYFYETLVHRAFEAAHPNRPLVESDAFPASLIVPINIADPQNDRPANL